METLSNEIIVCGIFVQLELRDRQQFAATCKHFHQLGIEFPFTFYIYADTDFEAARFVRANLHKLRVNDIRMNPPLMKVLNIVLFSDGINNCKLDMIKTIFHGLSYAEMFALMQQGATSTMCKCVTNISLGGSIFAFMGFYKEFMGYIAKVYNLNAQNCDANASSRGCDANAPSCKCDANAPSCECNKINNRDTLVDICVYNVYNGVIKRNNLCDFLEMHNFCDPPSFQHYDICASQGLVFEAGEIINYLIEFYDSNEVLIQKMRNKTTIISSSFFDLAATNDIEIFNIKKPKFIMAMIDNILSRNIDSVLIMKKYYNIMRKLLQYLMRMDFDFDLDHKRMCGCIIIDIYNCLDNSQKTKEKSKLKIDAEIFEGELGEACSIYLPLIKINKQMEQYLNFGSRIKTKKLIASIFFKKYCSVEL